MKKIVTKKDAMISFKKARGSLDKIMKMLENDEYCIDIMTQNLAVIGLLKSAHQILMENHLNHCFSHAIASKQMERKAEMVEEILRVTKLVNK